VNKEIEDLKRLVAVHTQLLAVNRQRIVQLSSAISSCDCLWDLEMSKIDKLGATTLLNTVAASQRLRELRLRREQLSLEATEAEHELARVQRIIEHLGERRAGLVLIAEEQQREESISDWAGRNSAS
jgi:hypothetical protein